MSAPRTARERARAEVMSELLAAAHVRLGTEGAANLSLRAIARDLGMASSAVYRYVESRDALLTLLIVEAFDALGDVCDDAERGALDRGESPASTWLTVARAARSWALEHPHSWGLIYGTPVPGYQAPQDTVSSAIRLWGVIMRTCERALGDGSLRPTAPDVDATGLLTPETLAFAGIDDGGDDQLVTPELVARAATLFVSLTGAISAEMFGHFHRVATDPARWFDVTIATAAAGVGLHVNLVR